MATAGRDLRLVVVGAAAWLGTIAGLTLGQESHRRVLAVAALGLGAALAVLAVLLLRRGEASAAPRRVAVLLWLCVLLVLAGLAGVRVDRTTGGAVAELAQRRASVTVLAEVTSDPVRRDSAYSVSSIYRARVTRLVRPAGTVSSPVLVLADAEGEQPAWGSTVELSGRLGPSSDQDQAAVLVAHRVRHVADPSPVHRAAGHVRDSIRDSAGGPSPGDDLVPALVDGDDADLPPDLVADFRTAGLTHLTAVSGANLTIVLAVLLPAARWGGVRGRGVLVVAAVGVVGFVLVARPEPSVLRAAVMGCVALVALGVGSRAAGLRALGAAVLGLLLVSPHLATTWGFALSVAATAGILLLGPAVSAALATHLPRPVADAVAVPLAAQVACTPLVAALSDEVSLVAVLANLVAAPLVAPTTVLGLGAGLVGLVSAPLAWLPGELAGWSAHGIVLVARRAASLPGASVPWAGDGWALVLLSVLCLLTALAAPQLARSRGAVVVVVVVTAVVLLVPGHVLRDRLLPGGWPPPGWVVAMCDVGQGDALALRAGPDSAVVVDAGPEPALVERCLDRLGVRRVPSLVLTHFHHDHVAGLPGVLAGREVGEIQVSPLADPPDGAALVSRLADEADVPLRVPDPGEWAESGEVGWQVLGPVGPTVPTEDGANDASLVLLAEVSGVRVLLTGDVEPPAQARLAAQWDVGDVDVVKVPHHGSGYQDTDWLRSTGAEVALVSAGRDNDYGHPAPATLRLLEEAGTTVWRTDRDGDVALVSTPAGLGVVLG